MTGGQVDIDRCYVAPTILDQVPVNARILYEEIFNKEKAEELRSKLVGYLKDVNYSLVDGIEGRVLVRN